MPDPADSRLGAMTSLEPAVLPLSTEQASMIHPVKLRYWQFPVLIKLNEIVDKDLAERALAAVVARHEPLRLRLCADGDRVLQRIEPPTALVPVGWAALSETRTAEEVARGLARVPMDLYGAGPVRATLLPHPGGSALLLVIHHLAWDNWSRDVLTSELVAAYRAAQAGRRPLLPRLRMTWTDHVHEQRRAGSKLAPDQLAHWSSTVSPSSSLPAPGAGTGLGRSSELTAPVLPSSSGPAAARFARLARVTPATVWHTIVLLAVARAFGTADFLYNFLHHGRDSRGSERLIGCFARTVVLRFQANPQADLSDLADLCRATLLAVTVGGETSRPPFTISRLTDQLDHDLFRPSGRLSRPLSRITINVLPGDRAAPAGAAAAPADDGNSSLVTFRVRKARLWFWLSVGDRIELRASFDARSFPEHLVTAVFDHVAELAHDLVARA